MRVAFIGPMGSGKTTAARHLVSQHGFVRVGFADRVKEMALIFLKGMHYQFTGEFPDHMNRAWLEQVKSDPAIRKFLQLIGTDLGRGRYGDDVWVRQLLDRLEELGKDADVAVDDCRFPNEAHALRGSGFTLIRIDRDDESRINYLTANTDGLLDDILNHPSEQLQAVIGADWTIPNVGSEDALKTAIDALLSRLD